MEKPVEEKKENMILKFLKELFIYIVIGGIIGIVLVFLDVRYGLTFFFDKLDQIEVSFITFILLIIISSFININIHEFGHFLFGKILGYKLMSYRFGIFSWNNQNGKMKFSIMINKGYSGLCAMLPPNKDMSKKIEALYYSGGIIFNLFFMFLAFIIADFFSDFTIINNLLLISAFLSGAMAIINFLPFNSGNNPTDGKIIWSILLKKPFAAKLLEINKVVSQLTVGIRPSKLKISFSDDKDNIESSDLLIIFYLYFKAVDEKNEDKILEYVNILENNIDLFPEPALPSLYYELCFQACISKKQEKAKKYYKKAGRFLQKDQDVNGLRVKAYYEYYVNYDKERALSYGNEALAVVDKYPLKGQAKMEEDLVRELIKKIELLN
ncbi:MAG: M50 family metallopeptidase [bacterium]